MNQFICTDRAGGCGSGSAGAGQGLLQSLHLLSCSPPPTKAATPPLLHPRGLLRPAKQASTTKLAATVASGSSPLPPLGPASSAGSSRISKRLQEAAAQAVTSSSMGEHREKTARAEEDGEKDKEDGGEGHGEPKAKKARAGGGGQGTEHLSLAIQVGR